MSAAATAKMPDIAVKSPGAPAVKSEWASLSIRERIQAMNKALDIVEERQRTSTPNSGLLLPVSTSEDTFPSSGTDVKSEDRQRASKRDTSREATTANTPTIPVTPSRSSVIDIWRSREGSSAKVYAKNSHGATRSPTRSPDAQTSRSSKMRVSDEEEKKEPNDSYDVVSISTRNVGGTGVAGDVGHIIADGASSRERDHRNPPSPARAKLAYRSQDHPDFTIVPAKDPTLTTISEPKRSRTNALWIRTGAGNSVSEAKQRLGIGALPSESIGSTEDVSASVPGVTQPITEQKDSATESQAGSKSGTVSPAETIISAGTVDTKRTSVTEIWDRRCRQQFSESKSDQERERPSSVPPPLASLEARKLMFSSLARATTDSKTRPISSKAASSESRSSIPPRAPELSISSKDEIPRSSWKQKQWAVNRKSPNEGTKTSVASYNLGASVFTDETPISARKQEGEAKNSQLKTMAPTSRASSETTQKAAKGKTVVTQLPAGAGSSVSASSSSTARRRGSITDRWKNVTDAHEPQEKSRDWDDGTTVASVNTRGSVADRWNQKMKQLSSTSLSQPQISKAASDASTQVGCLDDIANEGDVSVSTGSTYRWSKIGNAVTGPTGGKSQAETSVAIGILKTLDQSVACKPNHKDGSSSPQIILPARVPGIEWHGISRNVEGPRRSGHGSTKASNSANGPESDREVREDVQSSPPSRSSFRQRTDDLVKKISGEETKADALWSQQRHAHVTSKHMPPTAMRNLKRAEEAIAASSQASVIGARTSLQTYSRNLVSRKRNGGNTSGDSEVCSSESVSAKAQAPSLSKRYQSEEPSQPTPSWVKTVAVSSPDSVEVIQRGCVGAELPQRVLADALSSESIVPASVSAGAGSEEADEYSDESKSKPSKIIKSWSVRVYQTEKLPSSPRFSRRRRKFDIDASNQESVVLDSPKASPGAVCSSKSSAFNAWDGPSVMEQDRDNSGPNKKDARSSGKFNREFVSLGRRHIVQGLASKVGPNKKVPQATDDQSTKNHIPSHADLIEVAQSTSTDDIRQIASESPEPMSILTPVTDNPNPGKPVVTSRSVNRVCGVTPEIVPRSTESHEPPSRSTSRSSAATRSRMITVRKHLPSPRRRRKKNVTGNNKTPAVAANLSDIVEACSEDTNRSGPLVPRCSEVNSKMKGLEPQRRNVKQGKKEGSSSDVHPPSGERYSSIVGEARGASLEEEYSPERERVSVQGALDRAPIVPHQSPAFNSKSADKSQSNSLRSPVTDVDFSFLTDANSAHSGITSILSGGSLSNRAEKVLTERKREQRKAVGATWGGKHLSGHFVPEFEETTDQKTQDSTHRRSCERDTGSSERPRLQTRYSKSSRFLEPSQMAVNPVTEKSEALPPRKASAEQNCSRNSTGSSIQSADSGSDGSDTRETAQSRKRRRRKRKTSRRSLLPASSVASEQFLAENAAHFNAFSTAYRHFSLRDIATDLAGEIKMLSFNTSSFASTVNSKIALCVTETKKAKNCQGFMGFDDEDVAIEVEFMEDELDDDPTNSIEDGDDESTLEDQPNAQPGNRLCAPLGYQEVRD